jgi:transcriptional accessory protein Tex/SPT6
VNAPRAPAFFKKARKEERGGMEEKATQTPEKTFSMEEALQETEARLEKRVRPGQVLTGKVVFVGSEGVAVDIGAKTEGIIPFNQLTEKPLSDEELKGFLKPGDEVRVQGPQGGPRDRADPPFPQEGGGHGALGPHTGAL